MFTVDMPVGASNEPQTVYSIKDRLLKAIVAKLQEYKTTGVKLEPKADFMAKVKALYEQYVVAFDIPGIGPIIEKMVDDAMEAAFMKLVDTLYDRFAS